MKNLINKAKSVLLLGVLCVMLSPVHGGVEPLSATAREAFDWLAAPLDRSVGSPEHAAVQARLLEELRALENVTVFEQPFDVLMPVTEEAVMLIGDGDFAGEHTIYPVWPALTRLNTTPRAGISGRAVYLGQAELEQINPRELNGQVAVIEMADGNWERPFQFGAAAVLLLGSPDETRRDAHRHLLDIPVWFPRYYLPDGPLAAALRSGSFSGKINLRVNARWQYRTARNIYGLLMPDGVETPAGQPALVMAAAFDAVSALQGVAPGAGSAANSAALLALAKRKAAVPPPQPVLFAFLDAQGINQRGVREMLEALGPRSAPHARARRDDAGTLSLYEQHAALAAELPAEPDAMDLIHQRRFKPLHRYIKDGFSEELNRLDRDVPELRLQLHLLEDGSPDYIRTEAELERLTSRQSSLKALQNQMILRTPLSAANRSAAVGVWQEISARIQQQVVEQSALIERSMQHDRLYTEICGILGIDPDTAGPLGFVLGIDLSDTGTACGPQLFCHYTGVDEYRRHGAADFLRWLIRARDDGMQRIWPAEMQSYVNLGPLNIEHSPVSFQMVRRATLTSPAISFGVPAATWGTLEAGMQRADTYYENAGNFNWERFEPQLEATRQLIEALLAPEDGLRPRPGRVVARWGRISGSVVDQSPGDPVPRVPMAGFVTALVRQREHDRPHGLRSTAGVRSSEFEITGTDGRFAFNAMPADVRSPRLELEAYQTDRDGGIIRAISTVQRRSGMNRSVNVGPNAPDLRAMVFDCEEVRLPPLLFDVRNLDRFRNFIMYDAVKRREPQYYNLAVIDGMCAALVPPQTRWQLIARAGVAGARLLLLNTVEGTAADLRDNATGFAPEFNLERIPEYVAAVDFWRINDQRMRMLRSAGITSEILDRLHDRAASYIAEAETAYERGDAAGVFRASSAALANELRNYQGVRGSADDVIRAVMFLLLGLLPFSVVMERLLFASSHIYRQIAGTFGIFVVMVGTLWSFHPAFRITNQPLIIILAFLVIFLSLMAMSILVKQFESDVKKIRSGRAEESGADTARGGLLACALTIGIATMRKRKLRTTLTGVTVALITFALLSFSSTTRVMEFDRLELPVRPFFTGVLVQRSDRDQMSGEVLDLVESIAGEDAVVIPHYWWTAGRQDMNMRVHVVAPRSGRSMMLRGGMAFVPGEAQLTGMDRIMPDWQRFFDEPGGCYLAASTAAALELEPGDPVMVSGTELVFTGAFDGQELVDNALMLTGASIMPFDYTAVTGDERAMLSELAFSSLGDATAAAMDGIEQLNPLDAVFVARVPGLQGFGVHAVNVIMPSSEAAADLAQRLAQRLDLPIYFSTGENVGVLAAARLIPRPPRSLWIPLLVAGMIIFNTMLNSIAERRREIYVYTSLGLAPVHVAGIFMAEALTYGLMGGMSGYVFGQGLATLFSRMGWMGGITLNYSGTQVVQTMVLVIIVVLLAALVPALLAAKIASPSSDTGWKLPDPQDGVIHDQLPFTVTAAAASGVLAFVYDYLDAHREGNIGHFSSDNISYLDPGEIPGGMGGVAATVWIEPYDLGVRQDIQLLVKPAGEDDICNVYVDIIHRAGHPGNWHRMNRVFVSDLRRQLLGWRNIGRERVMAYIRQAEAAGMTVSLKG